MSKRIELIETVEKLKKELLLSRLELARQIGIDIETLRKFLDPEYTREFSLRTHRLVKNFIDKHKRDS